MRCLILATVLITSAIALAAQSASPAVTLEVASIKPAPPGSRGLVPGNWAPPTSPNARLRPMTLKTLVMYAFRNVNAPRSPVPEPVGGPAWIDQNRSAEPKTCRTARRWSTTAARLRRTTVAGPLRNHVTRV